MRHLHRHKPDLFATGFPKRPHGRISSVAFSVFVNTHGLSDSIGWKNFGQTQLHHFVGPIGAHEGPAPAFYQSHAETDRSLVPTSRGLEASLFVKHPLTVLSFHKGAFRNTGEGVEGYLDESDRRRVQKL